MKLVYTGAHAVVEVAETGQLATRDGDPIPVSDSLGKRLLEQSENWKSADAPASEKGGK